MASSFPEFSLAGKVILVTGGARGLGLTQCAALLEAGAKVYAFDRLEKPSDEFFILQKKFSGGEEVFQYRSCDVRDTEKLNGLIDEIAEKHGRMDGLIAAAGIQRELPALDYTKELADEMLGINITGVLLVAQAVAKHMIKFKNGGSIVLIASMSGTIANKGLICPVYNASKAGVIQLGRNLAMEWGPYNIRVNTISPGYIVTEMVEQLFLTYPERRDEWPKHNMLGRLSKPEEYRGAAVFLLSNASSFMTGSDLRIDGGHAAW